MSFSDIPFPFLYVSQCSSVAFLSRGTPLSAIQVHIVPEVDLKKNAQSSQTVSGPVGFGGRFGAASPPSRWCNVDLLRRPFGVIGITRSPQFFRTRQLCEIDLQLSQSLFD